MRNSLFRDIGSGIKLALEAFIIDHGMIMSRYKVDNIPVHSVLKNNLFCCCCGGVIRAGGKKTPFLSQSFWISHVPLEAIHPA
jgi:hypothetical protein